MFFLFQYKTFVPCFLNWTVPMGVKQTTHKDLVSVPLAFYWMHRTNSLVLVCGTGSISYSLVWSAWVWLVVVICHLACHLNVYRYKQYVWKLSDFLIRLYIWGYQNMYLSKEHNFEIKRKNLIISARFLNWFKMITLQCLIVLLHSSFYATKQLEKQKKSLMIVLCVQKIILFFFCRHCLLIMKKKGTSSQDI